MARQTANKKATAQALPDKVIATGFDCTTALCLSHLGNTGHSVYLEIFGGGYGVSKHTRLLRMAFADSLPLGPIAVTFGVRATVPTTLILDATRLIRRYRGPNVRVRLE